jgi:hypothetical protein
MPGLMDKLKGAASAAKVKVDVVVDKAGDKMPPKVRQTYEKVSDKVDKVIPKKDGDIDEQSAGAAAAAEPGPSDLTGEAHAAEEAEVHAAAQAEEAAAVAAEKAEGEADI